MINARDCLGFNYMENFEAHRLGSRRSGKQGWANNSIKYKIAIWLGKGYRVTARLFNKASGAWSNDLTELFAGTFEAYVDEHGGYQTIGFNYEPKEVG